MIVKVHQGFVVIDRDHPSTQLQETCKKDGRNSPIMRIVIAGCEPVTRRAFALLLRSRLGLEGVGEVGEESELMRRIDAERPDLVLLDDELPGTRLSDLIKNLRELEFQPALIVLSGRRGTEQVALAAGADAFVYKGNDPKELLIAIEKIRLKCDNG